MGLGYKRIHKELMHPSHLHAMRRADENLSDLVILGAIGTFTLGTFVWLVLGETPRIFYGFSERAEYLGFFWGVFAQFLTLLFLYWLMDTSPIWPRIATFCVGLFFGLAIAAPSIFRHDEVWIRAAYTLLAVYSVSNAGLAIYQSIKLAPSPNRETVSSKFERK